MNIDNVADIYPLTPSQAGILYHSLRDEDPTLYFEQVRSDITGVLDPDRLEAAWQRVINRHGALRTMFVWEGMDEPRQIVRTSAAAEWKFVDLGHLDEELLESSLNKLCADERNRGISLTRAPVSRFVLVTTGHDRWHFVWNFHHIVIDGWSAVRVFNEAFEAYHQPEVEVAASPPFRSYLSWLSSQDPGPAAEYWRKTLLGFDARTPLELGSGHGLPADGFVHGELRHTINEGDSGLIRAFARSNRVTMNTLVQAAWSLVLSRYSGNLDVVFGVTVSGRPPDLDGVEETVGMFLNTLPMRVRPPKEGRVSEWLGSIQLQQQDINTYQHSSLAQVQQASEVKAGDALFDSILIFENYPVGTQSNGRDIDVVRKQTFEQSHFPLTIMVGDGSNVTFIVLFDESKSEPRMVAQLLGHIENALVAMATSPEVVPAEVEILSHDERHTILESWNDTDVDLGPDVTLGELFAERARDSPQDTALIFGEESMTCEELDARSSRLANRLVAEGVGPGTPVGISMLRSFEMVIGILATVKAGGIYVPLDPGYPEDRIAVMVSDAGLSVILTHADSAQSVPGCGAKVIVIDDGNDRDWPAVSPEVTVTPADTVLITFTSGSTGRPKGVQGHHRGVINRIRWQWQHYPFADGEICCQKTTLNFVDHQWELWGALLGGAPLVLVPEDVVVDTSRFLDLLAKHQVRRIVVVPSLLLALLEAHDDLAARLPALKQWTVSGETVSRGLADRFRAEMPGAVLLNFYGMSEVTQDATAYDDRWCVESDSMPIGRPIANHRVYLLDSALRVAPVGVTADIYISGVGLSDGYWGRPDLTDERFIDHPFIAGERLYASGDRGRWLPSGDIEYVGRADSQVKVRGFRVELGEVEAAVRSHRGVTECVVTADVHAGYTRLLCYVVPSGLSPATELPDEVRDHAASMLPRFMVPALVLVLDDLPRTPNGKLDALALPKPLESFPAVAAQPGATEDEQRMLNIWAEVLETAVGLDDDFFDAGGHSLLGLKLVARIVREFGEEVPLSALFAAPTPRALTAYLFTKENANEWSYLVPISDGRQGRPNIFCVHGAGGDVLNFQPLGRELAGEWSLVGIQASGVDGLSNLHRSVEEFCTAYVEEIVAYQPEGPYIVAGYSAGGVIAYEVARRLDAIGRDVLAVGLLDTFHPAIKRARFPTLRRTLSIAASGPSYVASRLRSERELRTGVRLADLSVNNEDRQEPVPLEERSSRLMANMARVISGHEPDQFDGKVVLFAAARMEWMFERAGKLRGWSGVAVDLDYCEVSGGHQDLVSGSSGKELADAMSGRFGDLLATYRSR